ncbi:MAG: hypothetical protein IT176_06835 [Acidobacteria bacterium]|nr:hypothetical protein [Acidobacteriota bacterium]
MTGLRAAAVMACALVLAAPATTASGDGGLAVRVVPRFDPAPGSMRVSVSLEPDGANRRLDVEVDSGGYYRLSEVPLEGDRAARTYRFTFTRLPAGRYAVRVRVHGPARTLQDVSTFIVTDDSGN